MRVLCLIFAIVTILAQAPVPHANAAPTIRVTINIPTGANFGIPYAPKTKWQYSYADLLCTSKALEQCIVANMPLLSQVDDKLLHPTAHYTTRYLVKSGPNAGDISDIADLLYWRRGVDRIIDPVRHAADSVCPCRVRAEHLE
jgi:hypothetical protein